MIFVLQVPDPVDATVSISFKDGDRIKECSAVLLASKSRKILVTAGHCLEIYLGANENEKHSLAKVASNASLALVKDTEVHEFERFSDFQSTRII